MLRAMANDIQIACSCGKVTGRALDVAAGTGNRIVCMCDDCQAFAHHLGQGGAVLDASGGTEIFQMTPAQLKLDTGHEHVRCVRLTGKGLLRFYADCCRTPIANCVASPKVPFAGIPTVSMDAGGDGRGLDGVLGPVLCKVQGKFATGGLPADAHARAPLSYLLRSARLIFKAWRRGQHAPSPLFDAATGAPIVEPIVLTADERGALRAHCGPT